MDDDHVRDVTICTLSASATRMSSIFADTQPCRPSTRAPTTLNTASFRKRFDGFGANPAAAYAAALLRKTTSSAISTSATPAGSLGTPRVISTSGRCGLASGCCALAARVRVRAGALLLRDDAVA